MIAPNCCALLSLRCCRIAEAFVPLRLSACYMLRSCCNMLLLLLLLRQAGNMQPSTHCIASSITLLAAQLTCCTAEAQPRWSPMLLSLLLLVH
jgi:hypothetical protein